MVANESGVRETLGKLGSEGEEIALEFVINAWKSNKEKLVALEKKNEEMEDILKGNAIALQSYAKKVRKLGLESKASEQSLAKEKERNAKLHTELAKKKESNDELLEANNKLKNENSNLFRANLEVIQKRDDLKNERDLLARDKNDLTVANDTLIQENKDLKKERDKAMKQRTEAQRDQRKGKRALVAAEDKLKAYKKVINIAEMASENVEGGLDNFVTEVKKANLVLKDARTLAAGYNPGGKKTKSMRRKEKRVQESLSKKEDIVEEKLAATKRKAMRLKGQKLKKMRMNQEEDVVAVGPVEPVEVGGVELEEIALRAEVQ